jgi:amidophosphoribosyltransferase
MAITFPPIMHPCYMGVDFPNEEELLAYRVARDETDVNKIGAKVAAALGVEELHYNDVDGLAEAIGLPKESLCVACITGDYSKLGIEKPKKEEMKP